MSKMIDNIPLILVAKWIARVYIYVIYVWSVDSLLFTTVGMKFTIQIITPIIFDNIYYF
jgi:hypothetical protein